MPSRRATSWFRLDGRWLPRVLLLVVSMVFFWLWFRGGLLAADPPELQEFSDLSESRSVFPAYGSAWEALERFDFPAAERMGLAAEEKRLAAALEKIAEGDLDGASVALRRLWREAESSQVRTAAARVLRQILMFEGQWAELLRLLRESAAVGEDADDERFWAEAFVDEPSESIELPTGSTTVSSRLSISGVPVVPVVLNGRRYRFWLDTGASATVLAADVAAACGVTPLAADARAGKTSTSRRVAYRPALAGELAIGDLMLRNHPVAIVSREDLEIGPIRVRGIIGWPVFRHLRVEIDAPHRRTTFALPEVSPPGPRNLFWLGYPMVTFEGAGGVPLHFGLDTGARRTGLRDDFLSKVPSRVVSTGQGVRGGAGGFETVEKRHIERLKLRLDTFELTFERPSFTGGVKAAVLIRPDGKLGSDVGQLGKMVIDFPRGRFDLMP